MATFLWFTLVLFVLLALGLAVGLTRGEFVQRTPGMAVADLIFNLVMAGWALFLLLEVSHG